MKTSSELVNTQWTTCGRKLLKDGHNFFVRGINYAPTPIGKPGRLDMLGEPTIYLRDLQNLRLMNANAVKTYDFYSYVKHQGYLDAAYNDNVNPVYTIFSIWIDQSLMLSDLPETSPKFQHLVHEYYLMAKETGGHPGVMGYSIGGEMNSITVIQDKTFWSKFQALTSAVRRGLKENNNAQKIITTTFTFVDDGGQTFKAGEKFQADVDMWGSNVYQTDYPGSVIPKFLAVPGGKPLLVSEYGYPYASNKGIGNTMQLHYVADQLTQQTLAMQNNFQQTDGVDEQTIVGGFVFEYSDEWWKSGNPDEHNLGLVKNGQFPLGYLAEEYFGLFSASLAKPNDPASPNVLKARPTVSLLTTIWGNGSLATEGDLVTNCNSHIGPVTIGGTSNNMVLTTPSGSSFGDFMMLGLFGGVLFLLLVAIRTRVRRMEYHKLSSPSSPRTGWNLQRYQATETSLLKHDIDHQVV
ncbi:Glycoside hydrolase [Phytophthora palmivora]|uniref:Glycoside hydrolase n=1 Tax=Phytophthora palmivora TaxID=4796 RepID=A0A2P4YU48_9STRA|nr:Glycoside hydrolase [Phytophthora palmivora]